MELIDAKYFDELAPYIISMELVSMTTTDRSGDSQVMGSRYAIKLNITQNIRISDSKLVKEYVCEKNISSFGRISKETSNMIVLSGFINDWVVATFLMNRWDKFQSKN